MVAGRTDIFVSRRMVNYRNFGYSTVSYTMFNHVKDIRDLDVVELAQVLGDKVAEMEDGFDAISNLGLHQRNGNQIKYLLARMTAWLEEQCGGSLTFADFVSRDRKYPFEIEHIWANHPDRHSEFASDQAFADQRNRFGGLLLLPKDFNASYGDKPYSVKLKHYFGQNMLAKSLNPECYVHNPTFLRLRKEHNLLFSPIPDDFTVLSFAERQSLYQQLCELIWEPTQFGLEVPETVERRAAREKQRYYGISLRDLLDVGLLRAGQQLVANQGELAFSATVTSDGEIKLEDGRHEESPSTAGAAVLGTKSCNGWHFWQTETPRGLARLTRVRDDYLERQRS